MKDKVFVDSNVWLYLFLPFETNKNKIANEFILEKASQSIFISYQVINEVTNQLLRNKLDENKVKVCIEYIYEICTIHNFSKEIIMLASTLRERYTFSFWDSIITASALNSGCNTLVTEDMHDGLKIENMIIKNIFK